MSARKTRVLLWWIVKHIVPKVYEADHPFALLSMFLLAKHDYDPTRKHNNDWVIGYPAAFKGTNEHWKMEVFWLIFLNQTIVVATETSSKWRRSFIKKT